MKFKRTLDAEEVKRMLADYDIEEAIPVIEELQGYPLFECAIRDRIYGNYQNEALKQHREDKRRTYAVIKVRAKNEADARKKIREQVKKKPIRYFEQPYGNRYLTAESLTSHWCQIDVQRLNINT